MDTLVQDVRYAFRSLRRQPAFAPLAMRRWRSASELPPRSSAWSTPSCSARSIIGIPTASSPSRRSGRRRGAWHGVGPRLPRLARHRELVRGDGLLHVYRRSGGERVGGWDRRLGVHVRGDAGIFPNLRRGPAIGHRFGPPASRATRRCGRDRPRFLAAALRRTPRRHRPHGDIRRARLHDRRRDAASVPVSRQNGHLVAGIGSPEKRARARPTTTAWSRG